MKRTLIGAAVLALGVAGAGTSLAGPGSNGNNDYGLCRAYIAQSDHNPNGPSGPFQELAAQYEENADDSFYDHCVALVDAAGPGNSNGSHTNNGGGKGGQ